MEIRDNTFSRQFEIPTDEGIITVEYSLQDRKIFLTKIKTPIGYTNEKYVDEILVEILNNATEKKLKVVPVFPKIALFFRKNPIYKSMLPPGMRI